ncbi:NAD(P)-dependent alcohol dehydrogenase [Xanthobacter autotrophicus]|uniref:NAD(P)-dependent alcohol dehydrogenase n=1 Tax=Xanthobacter autotrophicus TaxID=280 RepID=UPI0037294757
MLAVRFYGKHDVRVVDVEKPVPKAGEVLIKIAAAGVCHSDLHVIHNGLSSAGVDWPFTLGHENAGWVEELGDGVTGFSKGDPVLVFGPWGCGHCHPCQTSAENYCEHRSEIAGYGGGLGLDGGMAQYMVVPSPRLLVPLGTVDPRKAAPLSDAALTPYHAIRRSMDKLTPDAFVVIQGIGGLGHMAIQIIKAITSVTVIACDITEDRLQLARHHGADHAVNSTDGDAAEQILKITGSKKAALVLDFVGIDATLALGSKLVGMNSAWTVVGLGGGTYAVNARSLPYGCSLSIPYWGTRIELMEVIQLAERGIISVETQEFPLKDALDVYQQLENGQIIGRAVLIP